MAVNNSGITEILPDNCAIKSKNLPILLVGYRREDLLRRRFEEIVDIDVPKIFVAIDATPKGPVAEIIDLITEYKGKLSNIDFCIRIQESNLGLTRHMTSAISWALEEERAVIVIEDDIKIDKNSYLSFNKGFHLHQEMGRTGIVGGFSPLRQPKFTKRNYWRKTCHFSVWGWIATCENWANYTYDLSEINLARELSKSETWNELSRYRRAVWISRFTRTKMNPLNTWDIQMEFCSLVHGYRNLLPMFRFVENEGYDDERSVHTTGARPRWFKPIDSRVFEVPRKLISRGAIMLFFEVLDSITFLGDNRVINFYTHTAKKKIARLFLVK